MSRRVTMGRGAGVVAAILACAQAALAQGAPPRVLRWGADAEGGAPFVEADPRDPTKLRGFDVEIAAMIARGLGREPEFVQVAWAQIPASVERGDFEIGMSGVEDRPAMHALHAVTIPYFAFREVLAVRPADSARFRTLADLAGRRVGTLGSTLAYQLLLDEQQRSGLVPVSYNDDNHPYFDLVQGRVDAVLLDHIIAQRSLRRLGGFVIQPVPVATSHYVIVLAKADTALRDSVNAILRAGMRDGSIERTFRAWNVWDASEAALFAKITAGEGQGNAPAAADSGAASDVGGAGGASGAGGGAGARMSARDAIAAFLPALLRAAAITLAISCLAMLMAVALGICVAAGRVYGGRVTRTVLLVYVEVMRGTPVLLQLFVIYYGLSAIVRLPAFAAAVIGLGLNYAAYEAEIYRGALQAVPLPQIEAARTLGFSEFQTLRLVRGPLALRFALAPMTNDFVALLKDSSLVSVITVVELTKQASIFATNIGSWVVPGILCGIVYLAMSLPLARAARSLERRWHAA